MRQFRGSRAWVWFGLLSSVIGCEEEKVEALGDGQVRSSGTRLAAYLARAGEASTFMGFRDEQLGFDCVLAPATRDDPNRWLCQPPFLVEKCSVGGRDRVTFQFSRGLEPGMWVSLYAMGPLGPVEAVQLGETVADEGTCPWNSSGGVRQLFEIAGRVSAASLVSGTLALVPVTDLVSVRAWSGDDGSRALLGMSYPDGLCEPRATSDGQRCGPADVGGGPWRSSDPTTPLRDLETCSQPIYRDWIAGPIIEWVGRETFRRVPLRSDARVAEVDALGTCQPRPDLDAADRLYVLEPFPASAWPPLAFEVVGERLLRFRPTGPDALRAHSDAGLYDTELDLVCSPARLEGAVRCVPDPKPSLLFDSFRGRFYADPSCTVPLVPPFTARPPEPFVTLSLSYDGTELPEVEVRSREGAFAVRGGPVHQRRAGSCGSVEWPDFIDELWALPVRARADLFAPLSIELE